MDLDALCRPVQWTAPSRIRALAMPLPDVTVEVAGEPGGAAAARLLFTFVPRSRVTPTPEPPAAGEAFLWGDTAFSGDNDRAWLPGRADRRQISASLAADARIRAMCAAVPADAGIAGALERERWMWTLAAVSGRQEDVMLWVQELRAAEPPDVRKALAAYEAEPDVGLVQKWAAEAAHADPASIRRLLRDARLAALLPQVDAEYKRRDGWDKGWDYYAVDGEVDEPSDAGKVYDVPKDVGADQDLGWTVRATWHLDEWLLSSNRVRAVAEGQDLVELRADLVEKVTNLYFERRKLQVKCDLALEPDLRKRVADELEIRRLTALIDGLTDGRFGAALARHK